MKIERWEGRSVEYRVFGQQTSSGDLVVNGLSFMVPKLPGRPTDERQLCCRVIAQIEGVDEKDIELRRVSTLWQTHVIIDLEE